MKRCTCIFLVLMAFAFNANAQIYQWAKNVGNATSGEWLYGMVADAVGNTISVGYFRNTVDFDPGPGVFNLTGSNNYLATYILKLDAAGNFVWAKAIVSGGNIRGYSIATDLDGNILIGGTFNGICDFDPGPGSYTGTASSNSAAYLLKLDPNGNFLWVREINSSWDDDYAYALTVDSAGNVYTTGRQSSTIDFDFGPGTSYLYGTDNLYVLKVNAAGNYVWVKGFGTDGIKEIMGIKSDAHGNLTMTGHYNANFDTDPGPGTNTITMSGIYADAFIIKLDSAGNHLWGKGIGGTAYHDVGLAITLDPSGNALVTGQFASTVDFDPGPGTANESTAGVEDIFVLKLDASGNYVWHAVMGGTGADKGYAIVTDRLGNVFTTGQFHATVDFDPGAGIQTWTSAGYQDAFMQILDSNGVYKNSYRWGSTLSDVGFAVAVPNYNSIYTGGRFDNTVDFDPGVGVANLTAGAYDVFVSKIDQCIPTTSSNTVTACNNYTSPSGHVYTASGTYTTILQNSQGCDSIITLHLTINVPPAQPGPISGNPIVCVGTSNTYSVPAVPSALSYTWTLPSGWSGSSTSNIIVTSPGPISGTISVTANDSCGASVARTWSITVRSIPVQPSFITGNGSVCEGSTQTYSVTPIPGATSYSWTLPSGWAGGSTGNSLSVNTGAIGGTISVFASNSCGNSVAQTRNVNVVTVPAQPSAISGNTMICAGSMNSYSIAAVPGATSYSWTLPSGWIGTSNNVNMNATAGFIGGNIAVTANDSCGASVAQTMTVTVTPLPVSAFSFTSNILAVAFTDQSTGANSWQWDFGDGNSATTQNPSHTYASSGIYNVCMVASFNGCTHTSCQSILVGTVGMEDALSVGKCSVFPNPSSGVFHLTTERRLQGQIVDAQGKVIQWLAVKAGENLLDLSAYPDGLYFLRLINPTSPGHHVASEVSLRLLKVGE
jgi:PKD repeat protein